MCGTEGQAVIGSITHKKRERLPMKTKGLISAIAFLGILWSTSVPAQSTLTVPNGEYRLIAACRLQAIETSPPNNWVGQSPQFELFQFYPPIEDFLTFQTLLSGWAPAQPVFGEGEGGIFRSTGVDATLVFQPRTQTT